MPSFHKLVKTNEVGMVLLQELDRESSASQDLLEATKQASECVPEGILPEPDLKTMRQVFEDQVEKTPVIDAFEPYRDKAVGSEYDPRNYAIYSVNPDWIEAFNSELRLTGISNNGEVSDTDMVNSARIPFSDREYDWQSVFEPEIAEGSTSEYYEVIKVFREGIYMFLGEYTLRILPEDFGNPNQYNNYEYDYAPIETLLMGENAEIKYRITMQQFVGGNGPYDEIPYTVIENHILAEGSFSVLDIVKGVPKVAAFNKLIRANRQDKFQIVIERSRSVCTYQNGIPDCLFLVKQITGPSGPYGMAYNPYGTGQDPSNFTRCILLVDDNFSE